MSIVIPSVVEYLYSLERKRKFVTVEMKVWGNCGRCKSRIEKAAKKKGVVKAAWDIDSKILTKVKAIVFVLFIKDRSSHH